VELRHTTAAHGEHVLDGEWTCRTCGEPVVGSGSRVERVLTPAGRALSAVPAEDDGDR
jgi:hypothetical protein